MSNKFCFISFIILLAIFFIGWEVATIMYKDDQLKRMTWAVPVIDFERFDESRDALIIGLFNPGTLPMEISRSTLFYQVGDKIPVFKFNSRDYVNKPLVIDPGDTILVPLQNNSLPKSNLERGHYWGELEFRVPGHADFYSLRHRFNRQLIVHQSTANDKD